MKNSRWLSLMVLCTGFLLIVVDMTIVNVALPSIQVDLGFSQSGLAWVVNAYLIAFGGLLLLAGRVGDLLGRKRVYIVGLAISFGVASTAVYLLGPVVKGAGFTALLLLMAGISALTAIFVSFLPGRVPRPVMVVAAPAPAAGK